MDRFACDWHRLAGPQPREGRAVRRNHGPGRVPYRNASPCLIAGTDQSHDVGSPRRPRRRDHGAPAARSARVDSTRVAPVVTTSSTSTTGRPATAPTSRCGTRAAPARLSARSCAPSPAWSAGRPGQPQRGHDRRRAGRPGSAGGRRTAPARGSGRPRGTARRRRATVPAPGRTARPQRPPRRRRARPRRSGQRRRRAAAPTPGTRAPCARPTAARTGAVVGRDRPGRRATRRARVGAGRPGRAGEQSRRRSGTSCCPRRRSPRRRPGAPGPAGRAGSATGTRPSVAPRPDGHRPGRRGRWTTPDWGRRGRQPGYAGSVPEPIGCQPLPEVNCSSSPSAGADDQRVLLRLPRRRRRGDGDRVRHRLDLDDVVPVGVDVVRASPARRPRLPSTASVVASAHDTSRTDAQVGQRVARLRRATPRRRRSRRVGGLHPPYGEQPSRACRPVPTTSATRAPSRATATRRPARRAGAARHGHLLRLVAPRRRGTRAARSPGRRPTGCCRGSQDGLARGRRRVIAAPAGRPGRAGRRTRCGRRCSPPPAGWRPSDTAGDAQRRSAAGAAAHRATGSNEPSR